MVNQSELIYILTGHILAPIVEGITFNGLGGVVVTWYAGYQIIFLKGRYYVGLKDYSRLQLLYSLITIIGRLRAVFGIFKWIVDWNLYFCFII